MTWLKEEIRMLVFFFSCNNGIPHLLHFSDTAFFPNLKFVATVLSDDV